MATCTKDGIEIVRISPMKGDVYEVRFRYSMEGGWHHWINRVTAKGLRAILGEVVAW